MGHVVEGLDFVAWIVASLVDKINRDTPTGRTPVMENSIDERLYVSKFQARALVEETYGAFGYATRAAEGTATTKAMNIGIDAKCDRLGLGETDDLNQAFTRSESFIFPAVLSIQQASQHRIHTLNSVKHPAG